MAETSLEVTCLDTARRYMALGARQPVRRAVFGILAAAKRIVQCVTVVRRKRPNVVYITCAPSLGLWLRDFPLLFILAILRVPTIVHLHGGSVSGFFGASRPVQWLSVKAFRKAAAVVVITRAIEARARYLLGSNTVRYIPNMLPSGYGVSARSPRQDPTSITVLHVGWQSREKGTLVVLEVASRLPQLHFVLVGRVPADFQPLLDKRIASLGLQKRVTFTGPIFGDALQRKYRSADLMLLPTQGEGFPMVVLEAMAHRLPVVATDVGAIADMLGAGSDSPAGFVVPSDRQMDIEALVSYVNILATTSTLRETLGSNGGQRVRREYDATAIVRRLDHLIRCVGNREVLPQ